MNWIKVYQASDMLDGHLVKGLLEQAGIECQLQGMPLLGAMGELPANVMEIPVLVQADQQYAARAIIEQRPKSSDTSWRCPHCGELNPTTFETCWHCKTEQPGESFL